MHRLSLFLILYVTSCVAQAPFACETVPSQPALLRFESLAERIADIEISCSGGSPGFTTVTNITLTVNTPVATPLSGVTLSAYAPVASYSPTLSPGNILTFSNVSIAGGVTSALRISGVRVAHTRLAPLIAVEPQSVRAFLSLAGVALRNPEFVVGYIVPSLNFQLLTATGTATDTLLPSPSAATLTHSLVFRESLLNSFRLQASEPGATQSTRLVAQFTNLPPGATLSVSASSLSGSSARLIATESGPFNPSPISPAFVPLPIINNSATAVWEILATDLAALESVTFGLIASGSSTAATVNGRYGPTDTISLPRFAPNTFPPTAGCNPTCVSVPRALSYTHRFGDPRPAAVPFPVTFMGPPTAITTELFAADSPAWFSVSNGMAQWSPELLAPGQYLGLLSVQPGNQFVHLSVTVLPPLNWLAAPPTCQLSTGVPPIVRAEGLAEAVARLVLICSGTPGATVTSATLMLRFNAPVRSAAVASTVSDSLEALAIGTDPTVFPQVRLAEAVGVLDGPNGLRFPNLSFTFPSSGSVVFHVVNVRLDAASLGVSTGSTPSTASVRAFFVASSPAMRDPIQPVAFNMASHTFTRTPATVAIVSDPNLSLPVSVASQVSFREEFSTAFKKRNEGTSFASPGSLFDQPFDNFYYTESMVYTATRGPAGLATQGTRLRVVFSGVPAGTTLYVTNTKLASSTSAVQAKRITVPANGAGPFLETPASVTILEGSTSYPASVVSIQNGVGIAVWEILDASPFVLDNIRFGVAAKGPSSGSITQITSSLAPLDDGIGLPRFTEFTPGPAARCTQIDCFGPMPGILIRKTSFGVVTQSAPATISTNGAIQPFSVASTQPWLLIGNPFGYAPATLNLSLSPAALNFAPGVYTATVVSTSATTSNSVQVPVTYFLDNGPPVGVEDTPPVFFSGTSSVLQFDFTHTQGFAQLDVVNALINTALDGSNACYIAYSRPLNVLYLVNNAGVGSGLSAPLTPGSSGQVSNGQCTISGAGSSAQGTGNILRLRLNVSFQSSFAGNRVLYLAARGVSGENSGWHTKGAIVLPGAPVINPLVSPVSPPTGATLPASINFTYTSTTPLETVWGLINSAVDARNACYFAYHVPSSSLFLWPNDGNGAAATTIPLLGSGTLENAQCTLAASGSSVVLTGNSLSLSLRIAFKPEFYGAKGIWAAGKTLDAAPASPWRVIGAWQVPLI